MFQLCRQVNGAVLWANLALLFLLSLFPFTTAWMDESEFARDPVIVYGLNLLGAALAYYVLQQPIIACRGRGLPAPRGASGRDLKGKLSPLFYIVGIALCVRGAAGSALAAFIVVALIWLVPDRRLEPYVATHATSD